MKIRKLQLKNIGVFDDETIEFQPCPAKDKAEIHIFTGENGSGKTTILQALAEDIKYDLKTIWQHLSLDKNKTIFKKLREGFYLAVETDFNSKENENSTLSTLRRYFTYVFHGGGIKNLSVFDNHQQVGSKKTPMLVPLEFCAFAYSGYRRIKDEPIEIGKEVEENPLYQALDFVKDENSKFTVNQWLGQNLLNSSLTQTKNKLEEAKLFNEKIITLEKVINNIITDETKDNEIKFEMQSATKLVLIKNDQELDFDVLPDGLKSLISWIGDLLMRLDSLKWKDDTPIFEREIILFLDEIEVHLHPVWQRKVLPVVQELFKNSQIFVSTHSPFVVNSVDDAWVYKLKLENGRAKVAEVIKSEDGFSYSRVLSEIFDIDEEFGVEVQKDLAKFKELRNKILASKNGSAKIQKEFLQLAKSLAVQSEELQTIVQFELRQLNKRIGKNLTI